MPATSGSPTQNTSFVETALDLAGLPDDSFKTGDFACVAALMPNGTFRLNRDAAGPADNVNVIETYSGNGFWEVFKSLASGEDVGVIPFLFSTASPLAIVDLPAGATLNRAEIVITEAFDDPASTLQLGTAATPGLVLDTTENDPSALGQYQSTEDERAFVAATLQLEITPAASTTGGGYVLYKLKRP